MKKHKVDLYVIKWKNHLIVHEKSKVQNGVYCQITSEVHFEKYI